MMAVISDVNVLMLFKVVTSATTANFPDDILTNQNIY
jgi:hypothetical protein